MTILLMDVKPISDASFFRYPFKDEGLNICLEFRVKSIVMSHLVRKCFIKMDARCMVHASP
jgi:hypothetical protein